MTFFVDDMKMSQFSPLLEECVQFSRIRKICLNPWLKLLTKILRFSPSLSLYIERPVNTISNVFRWKKQQNRWGRRIEEFRQNKVNQKWKKNESDPKTTKLRMLRGRARVHKEDIFTEGTLNVNHFWCIFYRIHFVPWY